MNIKYVIPENADVISSIGVALAMVREAVERIIPNASEEDILAIRREATEAAVIAGADPSSIETVVEIDTQTQRVRVTATGSTEVRTTDMMKACTPEEALEIAATSFDVASTEVKMAGQTDAISVFTTAKGKKNAIRIVDGKGFVRLQIANGAITTTTCSGVDDALTRFWSELSEVKSDVAVRPDIYVVIGSRLIEIVGISEIKQAKAILNSEIGGMESDKAAVVVGTRI